MPRSGFSSIDRAPQPSPPQIFPRRPAGAGLRDRLQGGARCARAPADLEHGHRLVVGFRDDLLESRHDPGAAPNRCTVGLGNPRLAQSQERFQEGVVQRRPCRRRLDPGSIAPRECSAPFTSMSSGRERRTSLIRPDQAPCSAGMRPAALSTRWSSETGPGPAMPSHANMTK